MTLFLAEGAVIMGIEYDYKNWTLMPPLPSYGQGRELKGPRYGSLIHGQNLQDVVITDYGFEFWWIFHANSCENMVLENSYISVGNDGIAIKSGWDHYGVAYGRPSRNILIRNVVVRSKISAGVSIGTEMSGGISDITFENVLVWDSMRGVRIKTAPGRDGYNHDIFYHNMTFNNPNIGIVIKTNYNEHPDEGFYPTVILVISNLTFRGVYGHNVRIPVQIESSKDILVRGISFRDMQVDLSYKKKQTFQCSYIEEYTVGPIFPAPCNSLNRYDKTGWLVKRSSMQNTTTESD